MQFASTMMYERRDICGDASSACGAPLRRQRRRARGLDPIDAPLGYLRRVPRGSVLLVASLLLGCGARTGLDVELAAGLDAGTVTRDGGPPARDASFDAPRLPVSLCALDAPNASIAGTTPFGAVSLRHAWAGEIEACGVAHVHLGSGPRLLGDGIDARPPDPRLLVILPGYGSLGDRAVRVVATRGDDVIETTGTMRIRAHDAPGDDPRGVGAADGLCRCESDRPGEEPRCVPGAVGFVDAELTIEGDGFSVRGELRAPHCHLFHAICF
jgi:hypothetical protein